MLLSVVESFVAAGPKLNPPVLGAAAFVEVLDTSAVVFVEGAPKPNPPDGAGAFDVSAAAAGAAPNNPPPLGFVFDASSDFDAAKLNPPPLPPVVVEGAGAAKLNPPPAAGAGALVDGAPKLNPIVLLDAELTYSVIELMKAYQFSCNV